MNVNTTLRSLEHLVSGYYNKGELKLEGNEITKVNNHVFSTEKNNVLLTRDDNKNVRQAVYECFNRAYRDVKDNENKDMATGLNRARLLLLGVNNEGKTVTNVAEQPLSRDEVRALVKALFRLAKSVTNQSWRLATPSELNDSAKAWFNRAEVIGGLKRGELVCDERGKISEPEFKFGKPIALTTEATSFLGSDALKMDSNILRGWNSRKSIRDILVRNLEVSNKAKIRQGVATNIIGTVSNLLASPTDEKNASWMMKTLRLQLKSDTGLTSSERGVVRNAVNAALNAMKKGKWPDDMKKDARAKFGEYLEEKLNVYLEAIYMAIDQEKNAIAKYLEDHDFNRSSQDDVDKVY